MKLKKELRTIQEIEDFVRGCTFYSTCGGGIPEEGINVLKSELSKGRIIGWVDVKSIPDEAWTACAYAAGSMAPSTTEKKQLLTNFGLKEPKYNRKTKLIRAIEELSRYTGKKIEAIVPKVLGGGNTPGPLSAAVASGIPFVDGDYVGRAIPETSQTTPCIFGKTITPVCIVDDWGNVSIIKEVLNYSMLERIEKLISVGGFGPTGNASFLMKGKEMKEVIIPGTLTDCFNLGQLIRISREKHSDTVVEIIKKLPAWLLIRGEVIEKQEEDKDGYYTGEYKLRGEKAFKGQELKVWFKLENHIAWKDNKVVATSPDLISVIDDESGEPIINPKIKPGEKVAVLVTKAKPIFRSKKGIEVLGPRHFGYDFDYIPIEDLHR